MKRVAIVLTLSLTVFGMTLGLWRSAAQAASPPFAFAPDEVLIQFRDNATDAQQRAARRRVNATRKEVIRAEGAGKGGLELASLPRGANVQAAINTLRSDPTVEFAEPNWIYTRGPVIRDTPSDRGYTNGSFWGVYSDDEPVAVGPAGTTNRFGSHAEKVWDVGSTGSKAVYVGVIDEGIQYEHCDLDANIWTNSFDPLDGEDNDGNGYVDDVRGWDFYYKDNTIYDPGEDNHGTHVAGTIGAEANNDTCSQQEDGNGGAVGLNWNVTLISANFLGPNGGYLSDAVKAVDYFTDLKQRHNLNIVALNNSWGGGGYSQALHAAIIRAAKADILFIAAAGNDGRNNDSTVSYPSGYDTTKRAGREAPASYDSVIAVAAIDDQGQKPWWSNYGKRSVDLGAPGVGIWSTTATPYPYDNYSGTSMATPHVTGAAALYASAYPGARAVDIRNALLRNTTPTDSLGGITATGGRLNISCALSLVTCTR